MANQATAVERWSFIEHNADDDSKDDLSRLLVMADKLNAELSTLAKRRFPEPLFGILSIPGVVMSRQMPYFALEMDNWTSSSEAKTAPIDTTFDLYRQVLILSQLYDEYGSK